MLLYTFNKTVTLNSSGGANVDFDPINGKLISIQYIKASSDSYEDGVDFTVTNKRSGEIIWQENNVNASKIVYPNHVTNKPDGSTNPHGANVTGIYDNFFLANDKINIIITGGGNAKIGNFIIMYGV